MAGPSVRLDLRVLFPVAALGIVVLVIIAVELCGREDVEPTGVAPPSVFASATPGPSFTPGPSPTLGPATPTATGAAPVGGSDERDAKREQDLFALLLALEQFRQDEGEYPNTAGNIQSLCVFRDADAGCDLERFIDPIPQDPLGDPAKNGYFYRSTGEEYTVYATREGDTLPECPEHPDHLRAIDSLYCVQGP